MASLGFTRAAVGLGPRVLGFGPIQKVTETFIILEADCLPGAVWDTLTAFAVGRHQEPSQLCK